MDAEALSPRGHRHRLVSVGEEMIGSTISRLLFRGAPIAVLCVVTLAVVAPLHADYFANVRTLAHVGEEVLELEPSVADGDPTSAVSGPFLIVRISAAADECRPCVVRGGSRAAVAVRRIGRPRGVWRQCMDCRRSLAKQAAATLHSATEQMLALDDLLVAAVAATTVGGPTLSAVTRQKAQPFDHQQTRESATDNVVLVDVSRHGSIVASIADRWGLELTRTEWLALVEMRATC